MLSDGLNTEDRWYTTAASIDARQAITCSNVKATGVIVYTVQVNTGGDPTSTVLKNCASDTTKFFMLTSGNQIITTFNQIATELANLHLSSKGSGLSPPRPSKKPKARPCGRAFRIHAVKARDYLPELILEIAPSSGL